MTDLYRRGDVRTRERRPNMPQAGNTNCRPQNCIQHWAFGGPPTSGSWSVELTINGTVYATATLPFNAAVTAIEEALQTALASFGDDVVRVSGFSSHVGSLTVEFQHELGNRQILLPNVNYGSLVGTGYGVWPAFRYIQIGRA